MEDTMKFELEKPPHLFLKKLISRLTDKKRNTSSTLILSFTENEELYRLLMEQKTKRIPLASTWECERK